MKSQISGIIFLNFNIEFTIPSHKYIFKLLNTLDLIIHWTNISLMTSIFQELF